MCTKSLVVTVGLQHKILRMMINVSACPVSTRRILANPDHAHVISIAGCGTCQYNIIALATSSRSIGGGICSAMLSP